MHLIMGICKKGYYEPDDKIPFNQWFEMHRHYD